MTPRTLAAMATAKKVTKKQGAAIAAAANDTSPEQRAPRGVKADTVVAAIVLAWRNAYVSKTRGEREFEVARPRVLAAFDLLDVDYIETDFGTLTRREGAGRSSTEVVLDVAALAAELGLEVAKLQPLVDKHTHEIVSHGAPVVSLHADSKWQLEAKQ